MLQIIQHAKTKNSITAGGSIYTDFLLHHIHFFEYLHG